jgi:hypothetical protein
MTIDRPAAVAGLRGGFLVCGRAAFMVREI